MIEVKRNRGLLAPLFQDYRWNYLVEAVLDGMMGRAWVDRAEHPQVAITEYPRYQFFIPAGDPDHPESRAFLAGLPKPCVLVFSSAGWESAFKEVNREGILEITRYAFTSENLRNDQLRRFASQVPAGYRLEQMHLSRARQLAEEKSRFAEDHFQNFDSIDHFINLGFGFCILQREKIVSAATTFVVCRRGIEIQINTREEHRRKGLATAVAARLMLHSLENNLNPDWDAANEVSDRLAKKLGYTPQGTYTMFVVTGEGD